MDSRSLVILGIAGAYLGLCVAIGLWPTRKGSRSAAGFVAGGAMASSPYLYGEGAAGCIELTAAGLLPLFAFTLVRLARSLGAGRRALAAEVDAHCAILGCDREQAQSHLLAALAYLSAHLEQFSEPAFARVCASCLDSLEALGS